MANLVLYRKYRPKTFSGMVGQEHIVKTLTNEILSGMISHSYLFSGPRGTGKTTLARLFAKAINCQNRQNFEPCNKCPACLEINRGRAVDLIEIDAASNRGIEEVRDLREGIKFSPTFLKYKVLILDESHQLSKDAANALLKILEEPPAHAVFILATTEIHKMIPTIISRCQRFDFYKLTTPQIIEKLNFICKEEKANVGKEALELIALNAEGSMRDAEGILDQILSFLPDTKIEAKDIQDLLGLVDINLVIKFTDFLTSQDKGGAINFLNENLEKGLDVQEFTKALISYLRKILIFKINPVSENPILSALTKEMQGLAKEQAKKFQEDGLKRTLKLFLEAQNKMKYASISQLPLEIAIIEAVEPTNN